MHTGLVVSTEGLALGLIIKQTDRQTGGQIYILFRFDD
jgi:hypothetical protein